MAANSFAELKKNKTSLNDKLVEKLKDQNSGGDRKADDRMWYPQVDKAGNGTATIRFLPAPPGEEHEFVTLHTHEFKDPTTGRWYIENSLTTIGKEDPVGEYNRELWQTGIEANQNICRHQKRKTYYFANVYVIKDSQNPENEGQVKIFKFGNWMYRFIKDQLIPELEDDTPVPVFDLWNGANFKIRIGKKGEHRNYDRSSWEPVGPLSEDDDELEKIWLQAHGLAAFVAPDQFKSYDELKKRFHNVIGLDGSSVVKKKEEQREIPSEEPRQQKQVAQSVDDTPPFDTDDAGDADDDFFARLAEEE